MMIGIRPKKRRKENRHGIPEQHYSSMSSRCIRSRDWYARMSRHRRNCTGDRSIFQEAIKSRHGHGLTGFRNKGIAELTSGSLSGGVFVSRDGREKFGKVECIEENGKSDFSLTVKDYPVSVSASEIERPNLNNLDSVAKRHEKIPENSELLARFWIDFNDKLVKESSGLKKVRALLFITSQRTSSCFALLIDHTTLLHRAFILFSLVPNLSPNLCAFTASYSLQHMQSTPDPCLTNFSNVRTSRVPKLRSKKKDFILKLTQIARKVQISILFRLLHNHIPIYF
ncbi:hypothetical protein EAG_04611 [Camponotus floridanus]|uniref:Uncharacterized protein n=1 Tax=Camponotus floridanus TaxID=104421 RepID=E2AS98_CAMFO|nr:hypothetical protein EAG_04611 [Camponotus floridanus]